jgi:hypothetical protein
MSSVVIAKRGSFMAQIETMQPRVRNWTCKQHHKWGDWEVLDTSGRLVCVVANRGTAELICDAVNGMAK